MFCGGALKGATFPDGLTLKRRRFFDEVVRWLLFCNSVIKNRVYADNIHRH